MKTDFTNQEKLVELAESCFEDADFLLEEADKELVNGTINSTQRDLIIALGNLAKAKAGILITLSNLVAN